MNQAITSGWAVKNRYGDILLSTVEYTRRAAIENYLHRLCGIRPYSYAVWRKERRRYGVLCVRVIVREVEP